MNKHVLGALAAALSLSVTASAAAVEWPYVQSHRGGSVRGGVATFAEESMPAFRSAWKDEHTVLELDVKLTKDRIPMVIHDDSLDRTTVCTGGVAEKTWADIRANCPSDVLGIGGITRKADPPVRMTQLGEILRYARNHKALLNIEIKNIPGESDFDSGSGFATTVCDVILRSGISLDQIIIQSFYPPNLDVAEQLLPGVQTAFLTFAADPPTALATAARGYEWWSPSGVPSAQVVTLAHTLGLKVVPWTIDNAADVKAVKASGADAVITNDPVMAKAALGGSGQ